ncbi:MAG TPA: hypothetical protein VFV80_01860 [Geminicoccaceae bacterium]|nr:hypothetical protein [Geminicoccaceae bacterium]
MDRMDALAAIESLKTADVVLFGAPGAWLARLWPRRTAWTHVGLVLRRPEDPQPLLWEAQDGLHRGTAVMPLVERVARFAGRVGVRCLNRPLGEQHGAALEALRRELARPPRHGLMDLIAAADDGWVGTRAEHLGDPTDAELVATVYQRLGLLDGAEKGGAAASRFRPRHFAGSHGLELRNGYALGPEIVLQEPAGQPGWSDFRPQPV